MAVFQVNHGPEKRQAMPSVRCRGAGRVSPLWDGLLYSAQTLEACAGATGYGAKTGYPPGAAGGAAAAFPTGDSRGGAGFDAQSGHCHGISHHQRVGGNGVACAGGIAGRGAALRGGGEITPPSFQLPRMRARLSDGWLPCRPRTPPADRFFHGSPSDFPLRRVRSLPFETMIAPTRGAIHRDLS